MNEVAEIIGKLYVAAAFISLARLKIDGAKCLMQASGLFRNDEYLMMQASEIDMNLWAELSNLRDLADKCGAKA